MMMIENEDLDSIKKYSSATALPGTGYRLYPARVGSCPPALGSAMASYPAPERRSWLPRYHSSNQGFVGLAFIFIALEMISGLRTTALEWIYRYNLIFPIGSLR